MEFNVLSTAKQPYSSQKARCSREQAYCSVLNMKEVSIDSLPDSQIHSVYRCQNKTFLNNDFTPRTVNTTL